MDRRGFLGAVAAGVAVMALPSLAKAKPLEVTTAAELTAWAESRFICSVGAAQGFFDLPMAEAIATYGVIGIPEEDKNDAIVRFTYRTLALATEGDDPVDAERRLTIALKNVLEQYAPNQHLVWRVKPSFETYQMTEFGDIWMTKEEMEDRLDIPTTRRGQVVENNFTKAKKEFEEKWYMRHYWKMADPKERNAPPIEIPVGVEYDFETDCLRKVERKYTLNKLRMRLVMPNLPHNISVADGITLTRI